MDDNKDEPTRRNDDEHNSYINSLSRLFMAKWKQTSVGKLHGHLSDFEIIRALGTGSLAVVFLVKHIATNKYYAMKALEKKRIIKLKQIQHTYYEEKILSCVDFPFLVSMQYCFKDNVYLYFVMPFVIGGEILTHLRRMGKFTENVAKFYGSQVILAFEYLHACNLVYRDLKPENVLVDETGYVKITDFGLCKLIHNRTWTLCGTPDYMAPEVILSKGYGKSADWWSLGVFLYELCAGYPPFFSSKPMHVFEKIISANYKCPNYFSNDFKDLLSHILQVDITRRYGNLKNEVLDIKTHKWFSTIDWYMILKCKSSPPFVPKILPPCDISNFELPNHELLKKEKNCLYENEFANF